MTSKQLEAAFAPPKNYDVEAGKPEWFLKRLVNELLTRQPVMMKRERYAEGRHDLPRGDARYMAALRDFRAQATTNYYGFVTRAPTERMRVTGFRFGPAGESDADAQSIWKANDMDFQSMQIHNRAAKYGLAYALVSPAEEGSEWPTVTAEDPRTTIVMRDPVKPTRSLAGLRMWIDDVSGYILAVLYLPDDIYYYQGPRSFDTRGMSIQTVTERLFAISGGGFEQLEHYSNELGEVPIVEYVWRPESGVIPHSECSDLMHVQDRINQTIFTRIAIGHYQAYKQRYVSGADMPKGKKARRDAPFDPGMDMLWVTYNDKTKFGEFASADLRQILEAATADIGDFAALTSTPAHYLMGKMANISGETLTQAESGFVSKLQQRMNSMGWSHERLMKLCFAYMGQKDKAKEVNAETLWADPQKQIQAELALAGQQWAAIGIPLELIMKRQDWANDDIEYAVEQKKIADQQALEQQQMLADQTHQQNMEMASVKGPPGSNPTKTKGPAGGAGGNAKKASTTGKNGAPSKPTTKPKAPGGQK